MQDENSFEGTSYYRLKQWDIDKHFVFSKIVAVKGYTKSERISVYPNPAINVIFLNIVTLKSGNGIITLYDATNRVIQQSHYLGKGVTLKAVNVSVLAKGIYLVKVARGDNEEMIAKFVKQ